MKHYIITIKFNYILVFTVVFSVSVIAVSQDYPNRTTRVSRYQSEEGPSSVLEKQNKAIQNNNTINNLSLEIELLYFHIKAGYDIIQKAPSPFGSLNNPLNLPGAFTHQTISGNNNNEKRFIIIPEIIIQK